MKPYHTGIIFVHGIQGKPSQFGFLTERVPESVLVRNILLPGHGATTKEFSKATSEQWLDAVRSECRDMSEQCENLIYVGHSMGCLLGLLTERELKSFSAMLLICCPFYVRPTYRYFRNGLLAAAPKRKTDDEYVRSAREANGVSARSAISYLMCVRPYLELFKLIRLARKRDLTIPENTVFCYSERDEIVSGRCARYTENRLSAKVGVMERCGHNFFTPQAKSDMTDIMLDMIEKA